MGEENKIMASMDMEFEKKLREWYGKHLKDFRIIQETDQEVLLLVKTPNTLEIARIFSCGDTVQISVDADVSNIDLDSIFQLCKTVARVVG